MLSFTELLNPEPSLPEIPSPFRPRSAVSSPSTSTVIELSSKMDRSIVPKGRTAKGSSNMTKSKLRGHVVHYPFENLDQVALRQVEHFQVDPFGSIFESCQHIPYNSGKKDFFEKTGRESFEVFRYVFKYPGHDTEYVVMWDYNVGLVRMTPFFKCCGYGKTVPAKMLGLNPGLKEITHSITGGSIAAQGYWMPYHCAKAVCATFCSSIAGALIPIFGADFPSHCIPPHSPDFGRMVIDSQLVHEATRQAEIYRRMYSSNMTSTFHNATSYPRETSLPRRPYTPEHRSLPCRPRLICDPSLGVDYDLDGNHWAGPNSASSVGSDTHRYMVTSRPSSSWNPVNLPRPHSDMYENGHVSNIWLSAFPRAPSSQPYSPSPSSSMGLKRRLEYDSDNAYEGSASPNSMSPGMGSSFPSPARGAIPMELPIPDSEENKAAMLLVNFSMQHQPSSSERVTAPPFGSLDIQSSEGDEHRSKRHQASPR